MTAQYRRIMVIGPCGAGKSTAAFEIARLFDLPLFHMDKLNWKPGWVETETLQLRSKVAEVAAHDSWVIEGNYGGTMELRLPRAEAVVYLDYPIPLCLFRIVKRVMRYRGRTRPDMGEGCPEQLNLSFLWYVARWNSGPKPRTEAKLVGHEDKVLHFRHPKELKNWLSSNAG